MSDHTSHIAEAKRLERSSSDRWLSASPAASRGTSTSIPAFFRVGFVVLSLLGGSGILIYAAAALVMPAEGAEDSVATRALRQRRDRPWPLIGLGLLAVAGAVVLSDMSFWPHGDVWVVLAIAGGGILWLTRHGLPEPRSEDEAARPSRSRGGTPTASGGSSRGSGSRSARSSRSCWSRPRSPRRCSTSTSGTGSATGSTPPSTVAQLDSLVRARHRDAAARPLRRSSCRPARPTRYARASISATSSVTVPSGVALQVVARARAGDVRVLGEESDGWEVERRLSETGDRTLVLDASVGAGSVRVDRAVR